MTLISVEQAAKVLGVSRTTAYRMVNDHLIPTVRFMKRGIRVHAEKLQEMIDAEADASMVISKASRGVSIHGPKRHHSVVGQLPPTDVEREYNELMAIGKAKRKR